MGLSCFLVHLGALPEHWRGASVSAGVGHSCLSLSLERASYLVCARWFLWPHVVFAPAFGDHHCPCPHFVYPFSSKLLLWSFLIAARFFFCSPFPFGLVLLHLVRALSFIGTLPFAFWGLSFE